MLNKANSCQVVLLGCQQRFLHKVITTLQCGIMLRPEKMPLPAVHHFLSAEHHSLSVVHHSLPAIHHSLPAGRTALTPNVYEGYHVVAMADRVQLAIGSAGDKLRWGCLNGIEVGLGIGIRLQRYNMLASITMTRHATPPVGGRSLAARDWLPSARLIMF